MRGNNTVAHNQGRIIIILANMRVKQAGHAPANCVILNHSPRYCRKNNGKVYNYFCPNDGTVSLRNIQGSGWRGIPQDIAGEIPNLYQRVFCQHVRVGKAPDGQPI